MRGDPKEEFSLDEICSFCRKWGEVAGVPSTRAGCPDTKIHPPKGEGWQMWETTSEGSPISPVFATPEELARWLADSGASAFGDMTATREQWLSTIREGGAVSAVMEGGRLTSGVAFCEERNREEETS